MNAAHRQLTGVRAEHAGDVALPDRGGVRVGGVHEELHGHREPALQVARVIVRNHHPGV